MLRRSNEYEDETRAHELEEGLRRRDDMVVDGSGESEELLTFSEFIAEKEIRKCKSGIPQNRNYKPGTLRDDLNEYLAQYNAIKESLPGPQNRISARAQMLSRIILTDTLYKHEIRERLMGEPEVRDTIVNVGENRKRQNDNNLLENDQNPTSSDRVICKRARSVSVNDVINDEQEDVGHADVQNVEAVMDHQPDGVLQADQNEIENDNPQGEEDNVIENRDAGNAAEPIEIDEPVLNLDRLCSEHGIELCDNVRRQLAMGVDVLELKEVPGAPHHFRLLHLSGDQIKSDRLVLIKPVNNVDNVVNNDNRLANENRQLIVTEDNFRAMMYEVVRDAINKVVSEQMPLNVDRNVAPRVEEIVGNNPNQDQVFRPDNRDRIVDNVVQNLAPRVDQIAGNNPNQDQVFRPDNQDRIIDNVVQDRADAQEEIGTEGNENDVSDEDGEDEIKYEDEEEEEEEEEDEEEEEEEEEEREPAPRGLIYYDPDNLTREQVNEMNNAIWRWASREYNFNHVNNQQHAFNDLFGPNVRLEDAIRAQNLPPNHEWMNRDEPGTVPEDQDPIHFNRRQDFLAPPDHNPRLINPPLQGMPSLFRDVIHPGPPQPPENHLIYGAAYGLPPVQPMRHSAEGLNEFFRCDGIVTVTRTMRTIIHHEIYQPAQGNVD